MTKPYGPPYVRSDAGVLAGAIVCRPSAAVDQLPPLQAEPAPIAERARDQHAVLVRTLRDRGVALTVLDPVLETSTESLVGDLVLMLSAGAVLTRPSAVERRGETAAVESALAALGVPVIGRIAAPGLLDAGDVVLAGDRVFIGAPRAGGGLRPRSNALGRRQLAGFAEAAGLRVLELTVEPNVRRLRSVFNVIAVDTAIVAPQLVDVVPVTDLRLLEVPRGEEYGAGVLPLGDRRVLINLRFRQTYRLLRAAKIDVEAIDLWEFGKAGVGPFQLVAAVKRG